MSFNGLHTALSGIRAGQNGLDTASNNISNANTDGYTRQRVELSQTSTIQRRGVNVGQGVQVDGIHRLREDFLDTRARATGAEFSHQDTRASLLQRTEELFAEPDHGLSETMGELWDAFEDLGNEPDDLATREQVVGALETLAGRFNGIAQGLDQLESDTHVRLDGAVDDANELLGRLDELNDEISAAGGRQVNALRDERDLVLDDLSNLVGVDVQVAEENEDVVEVSIGVGGQTLVDIEGVQGELALVDDEVSDGQFLAAVDPDNPPDEIGEGDALTGIRGEIPSLIGFLSEPGPGERGLGDFREQLDDFADDFMTMLNAQHNAPVEGNDDIIHTDLLTGGEDGAGSLRVDEDLDPDHLIAGETTDPLDGRNAEALADLRETPMNDVDVDDDLPEGPAEEVYRNIAIALGRETRSATEDADTREGLYSSAEVARSQAHDVSIDEEMVGLMQFQRALEASSRAMTSVDEALDTLINRTGLVGR
ncbi:flagellar hook-associated protein FlgK [Egibacter rhizosphaerae]|uniref:Flagellar hook-associated protein 1 n=1 Tax=Egibacter rhizosphaerae TaxID=1670831 RepID=A0A411YCG5_9ACTN|nr:flagellar hook-associated protein FlgK [Egibacter rhizosphaerae]QBI18931.1 flagellar hook-associated protein FlgK [Egibacter rhizosphaerae]